MSVSVLHVCLHGPVLRTRLPAYRRMARFVMRRLYYIVMAYTVVGYVVIACNDGLDGYGLDGYGLYSCGTIRHASPVPYSYDLYSCGLYSHSL